VELGVGADLIWAAPWCCSATDCTVGVVQVPCVDDDISLGCGLVCDFKEVSFFFSSCEGRDPIEVEHSSFSDMINLRSAATRGFQMMEDSGFPDSANSVDR